jgi:hypothetical protein
MCPVCVAAIALVGAGATTSGGLAVLLLKRRRPQATDAAGAGKLESQTQAKGDDHESTADREPK